jgi:hypothetical protein
LWRWTAGGLGGKAEALSLPVLKAFTGAAAAGGGLGRGKSLEVGTVEGLSGTSASLLMGACRDGGPLKRSDKLLNPRRCFSVLPAESVSSFDVAINSSAPEDSLISVDDSLAPPEDALRSERNVALLLEFCCEGGLVLAFDDVSPSDFFIMTTDVARAFSLLEVDEYGPGKEYLNECFSGLGAVNGWNGDLDDFTALLRKHLGSKSARGFLLEHLT